MILNSSLLFSATLTTIGFIVFAVGSPTTVWKRILFCTVFLSACLYSTVYYTIDSLTGQGFDESVLYHLNEEVTGAGTSDFSNLIITTITVILVGLALTYGIYRYAPKVDSTSRYIIALSPLVASFAVHPLSFDLYRLSQESAERPVQIVERYEFHQVYRDPRQIEEFNPRKNLIYIYMESLERTYFDDDLFPDVVPHLREWEDQAYAFTNLDQARGTGWTIGGMVSSQCGIPLVTMGSGGNSMAGARDFLPGAFCLGDMLKDAGYHLAYIGGADLAFAGKGRFYESHGFDLVMGKDAIIANATEDIPLSDWGVFDDKLFDILFDQYQELSNSDKPFGLFGLTLDTHHPKGNPSPRCVADGVLKGDNSSLDSVRCTDYLLSDFITRVFDSNHADDTLIVVASDHFAMPNAITDVLERGNRRNTFFVLEKGAKPRTNDTAGTTLDIAPTLLSFMGYPGEAFGLGRDLTTGETLSSLDPTFARQGLWKLANNVREFWMMPNINDTSSIDVDVGVNQMRIGQRVYQIPILMSADAAGSIDRIFLQDVNGPHPVAYAEHPGSTIAIERCAYFESEFREEPGFCLFIKNPAKSTGRLRKLSGNTSGGFVTQELQAALNDPSVPGFVSAMLNPVVLSSGIGQVPSGIYSNETQLFSPGLNVVGINDGNPELLRTINSCALSGKPLPQDALITSIAAEFRHAYDYLAIATHHSALCGDPTLKALFADSPLTAPDDRMAYVGVLDSSGKRVLELSGMSDGTAKLFITDLYKKSDSHL